MFWVGLGFRGRNARVHTCDERRLESRSRTFGKKVPGFSGIACQLCPRPRIWDAVAAWGCAAPLCVFLWVLAVPVGEGRGYLACQCFWSCLHLTPGACSPHARPAVLSPGEDAGPRGLADFRGAHTLVREVHNCFWCLGALQSSLVTCRISAYCPAE